MQILQFSLCKILSLLCYKAACEKSNLGVNALLLALTNFVVYIYIYKQKSKKKNT